MTGGQVASAVLSVLAMLGFVVGGVLAYTGRWAPLRRAMIRDPKGQRPAGALWMGLLVFPVAVLIITEPAPDGGLTPLQMVAMVVMGVLLLAAGALAFNRPAVLTRLLTPRWLRQERERRFVLLSDREGGCPPHRSGGRPAPGRRGQAEELGS